jgi:hypothetical protein
LFRLDSNSGELKPYVHDPADLLTLGDGDIGSTGEDRNGNFELATSKTLNEFDRQAGKVKRHIQVGESGIRLWFHEETRVTSLSLVRCRNNDYSVRRAGC